MPNCEISVTNIILITIQSPTQVKQTGKSNLGQQSFLQMCCLSGIFVVIMLGFMVTSCECLRVRFTMSYIEIPHITFVIWQVSFICYV